MCELLKPKLVAERLNVSRETIFNLMKSGALMGCRVGNQWRITAESVERLINLSNVEKNNE